MEFKIGDIVRIAHRDAKCVVVGIDEANRKHGGLMNNLVLDIIDAKAWWYGDNELTLVARPYLDK